MQQNHSIRRAAGLFAATAVVGIEFEPKEIDFSAREKATLWPSLSARV